jgi:hypothetical protein
MVLFKRLDEFPEHFIDFDGNVFFRNRFIKQHVDSNGYIVVALYKEKRRYTRKLHRLLSQSFIENPNAYPVVDHIDRNKQNNSLDNLRWVTTQKNGHNRADNNEHLNIIKRNDRKGYRVQFSFKSGQNIDRSFENLDAAIAFRDIIQTKIDSNDEICQVFVDLYQNDMKHIAITKYGKYQLIIKKPDMRFDKSFKTLDDVKKKREELLKEYYSRSE